MPPSPPSGSCAQLQWLVDRATISDLVFAFARAIDDQDQAAYADCFTADGSVALPHGSFAGQQAIKAMRGPPPEWATHHLSANHQIVVNGDAATVRAYVIASHVFERESPLECASAGGWYDMELIRTSEGWRLHSVRLQIVWATGEMIREPGSLG